MKAGRIFRHFLLVVAIAASSVFSRADEIICASLSVLLLPVGTIFGLIFSFGRGDTGQDINIGQSSNDVMLCRRCPPPGGMSAESGRRKDRPCRDGFSDVRNFLRDP